MDGAISLSEAITAANNSPETVTISFNITDPLVGGVHTFTVGAGGLPAITDTVIIDGTTDPDYAGDADHRTRRHHLPGPVSTD